MAGCLLASMKPLRFSQSASLFSITKKMLQLLMNPFFVILLVLAGAASSSNSSSSSSSCFPSDIEALLSFKRGLSDPHNVLSSWRTNSPSCCLWYGVSCDDLSTGRVTQLRLRVSSGRILLNSSSSSPDLVGSTLSKLSRLQVLELYNLRSLNSPSPLPVGLKSLRNLKTLSLNEGGYSGTIPPEWSQIISLQTLDLSSNSDITGPIPQSFCSLTNLHTLNLARPGPDNGLNGTIPACIGDKLIKLTTLDLSYNALTGNLPASIGNLANLTSLKLTGNSLTGPIPSTIGNLRALQVLNLNGNLFSGSIPQSLGQLGNLVELRIGAAEEYNAEDTITALNKQLGGTIPAGIGLPARSLRVLRIRGTSVTGSIPDTLGRNHKLREIYLDQNALTGAVPASLGLPKKLAKLNLASNRLTGIIPAEIARPKSKLNTLNMANNQLSGPIPSSFSNLTLETLDLSNNNLQGDIPDGLGHGLLSYGRLYLSNNKLTGSFPKSLANLRTVVLSNNLLTKLPDVDSDQVAFYMDELSIASNELSGTIPAWVFKDITFVDLSVNKLVSPLPPIEVDGFSVNHVNISHNLFTGPIPEVWGNVRSLNTLDFSFNQFSGSIPSNFSASSTFFNNLVLAHNQLSGSIPSAIFASGFFNSLDLSHNQLSGPIPDNFPSDTPFLSFLDFSYNQLSGTIPPKLFTYSSFIEKIKLDHNQFTGPIPDLGDACTGGLQKLNFVTLNDNKFTGSLQGASWIAKCADKLTVFDISGNNVGGGLPDFSTWTNIKVLNLARNKFTGSISKAMFTSLASLEVLDLSGNNLGGSVPLDMAGGLKAMVNGSSNGGALKPSKGGPYYQDGIVRTRDGIIESFYFTLDTVYTIDLSHNKLTGSIASQVGLLKGLQVLDLSSNSISGTLPQSLGTISLLQILDVSHNSLQGSIPSNLQKFPASSFLGNPQLCGPPLSVVCH